MIVHFLLKIVALLATALTFFLPDGSRLPFGTDNAVATFFGWIHSLIIYVWPLQVIYVVIGYYLLFKIGLFVLKLIIGHRSPKTS